MLVVLAGFLLVAAVGGLLVALRDRPLWNALRKVRPATPERLARAAADGHLDGRLVAVTGLAAAGPDGALRSAVNNEPCVWHHHVVHRRQITRVKTQRGEAQRRSRRKLVADVTSPAPIVLRAVVPAKREPVAAAMGPAAGGDDEAMVVAVLPEGMRVHRPIARRLRILPSLASEPFPAPEILMGQVQQLFWHREWLLRPGAPLFVLGEVRSSKGRVTLAKPERGPHIISTRRASALRLRRTAGVLGGFALAVGGAAAAAILLIAHYA